MDSSSEQLVNILRGHEVSFLPCITVCAAAALCEQVWAAGWRGLRKKKALWRLFMPQETPACLKTKQKWQENREQSCCRFCLLVDCWRVRIFSGGWRNTNTGPIAR